MIKGRKALKAISVRWWQTVNLQTCCLTVCMQTCPCTSAEQWQQAVPFSAPPWNDHPTPTGCTPSGKDLHAFCAQELSGSLLAQKCTFCLGQPLYRVKAKNIFHYLFFTFASPNQAPFCTPLGTWRNIITIILITTIIVQTICLKSQEIECRLWNCILKSLIVFPMN